MANDKDFIVKNAVEVGKDTKVTLGTITSSNIDLSTGNFFSDTAVGATTYTLSNPGDVQSFQLEVTGGAEEVASSFSTTLYSGGTAQTISNGIDFSTDGGLVWIKRRTGTGYSNQLFDTERTDSGTDTPKRLSSDTNDGEAVYFSSGEWDWLTNGFDLNNTDANLNGSGGDYVAWSFKKESSFFDIVTYTGDGTQGRTISHNLGSVPGCIIVKTTSTSGDWAVYHRGVDATAPEDYKLELNGTGARAADSFFWDDTAPTSTNFTVGAEGKVNGSGKTYVAYLFAHDTASDGYIQCGNYTGNASTSGPTINLGWTPQWVLLRNAAGGNWVIVDTKRGTDKTLYPSSSAAENGIIAGDTYITTSSTGFQITSSNVTINQNTANHVYIAIRDAADTTITWPSSIEWAGSLAPAAPANGETDLFTISTDDGGTTYHGFKTADNLS
tara:strand:+ start:3116 stop:4438 length:1323 start_codon:yes stop_codon:yes gene_type:complete